MLRWGIIGVGRAGAARTRAIAADPRCEAAVGYRGDPEAAGLMVAESVPALIAAVDAVAVCSPDRTHPILVTEALEAGRHVVCEFPLAGTEAEASKLLDLARERQRVLHVEHIELLGSAAGWWRELDIGAVRCGVVTFESARQDISATDGGLARLHRILDILGPPEALRVDIRTHAWLSARLRWGEGEVDIEFRSGPGLSRKTTISLDCAAGSCRQEDRRVFLDDAEVTLPPSPPMFTTDQRFATDTILHATPHYLSRSRLLCALRLRDALSAVDTGSWQGFSPPG